MNRFATFGAIALLTFGAVGCSGCQVVGKLAGNQGLPSQTLVDEKALYAAEASLYGANAAAEAAVDSGLLKPGSPDAVKIADWLDEGHKAIVAARAAYKVGDAKTALDRIAAVQTLVGQAWAIIPKKA